MLLRCRGRGWSGRTCSNEVEEDGGGGGDVGRGIGAGAVKRVDDLYLTKQ